MSDGAWLLVAVLVVVVVVCVLSDRSRTRIGAYVVSDPPPADGPIPDALLGGTVCAHDWRQVDELVEHGDTASVLQVCTRCPDGARVIPLDAPRVARQAGEDR